MQVNDYGNDVLLAEACRGDVDQFCKQVKGGGGRVHACLRTHRAELSSSCRKEELKLEIQETANLELRPTLKRVRVTAFVLARQRMNSAVCSPRQFFKFWVLDTQLSILCSIRYFSYIPEASRRLDSVLISNQMHRYAPRIPLCAWSRGTGLHADAGACLVWRRWQPA